MHGILQSFLCHIVIDDVTDKNALVFLNQLDLTNRENF